MKHIDKLNSAGRQTGITKTCLDLSCPKFRSFCCKQKSEVDKFGRLVCYNCGLPFKSGQCTAGDDIPSADFLRTGQQNECGHCKSGYSIPLQKGWTCECTCHKKTKPPVTENNMDYAHGYADGMNATNPMLLNKEYFTTEYMQDSLSEFIDLFYVKGESKDRGAVTVGIVLFLLWLEKDIKPI